MIRMGGRWIAVVLLVTTVFGLFSYAGAQAPAYSRASEKNGDFLSAGGDAALLGAQSEEEKKLLNVAATDEDGNATFQIVYNLDSSQRVQEQCETLAADIYDATGVTVPVVHSSEQKKTYEIMVGDVNRSETIDRIDDFRDDLEDTDFVICVVDTRVVIYATTDQALVSAVIFFMDQAVTRSELQGIYGLSADYEFTYHPNDVPVVTQPKLTEDRYVEFSLENGPSMYTYVRLSFTGNEGWRIQTKYSERTDFRDTGACQLLAYSLGEHRLGTEDERFYTEEISTASAGDVFIATSKSGSRVEINLAPFQMDFYSKSGAHSACVTNILHNAGASTVEGVFEEKEAVFGTGERFNGANQRGKKIEMFTKDIWSKADACYMAIPLLSTSRGTGILVNNYEHMMLDLDSAKNNTWSAVITGAPLDCYVFTTEKISDVIYHYSSLSGFAELPEEWTYGLLVCSLAPEFSQKWTEDIIPDEKDGRDEGVYDMIAMMETYDLPWTGVLAEAWDYRGAGSKWHEDLKELCDYVHSLGKKFIVYMGVAAVRPEMSVNKNLASEYVGSFNPDYYLYQQKGNGKGYLLPETGSAGNNPDNSGGDRVYLDITNPKAVQWYFDEYWTYLI